MRITPTICESCRIQAVEIVDYGEGGPEIYRICKECYQRLINYALRPREFFNLASIHGHSYYLNDDFYDSETGEATQPETEVEDPERFPFPDLNMIGHDLEMVVDFACVQYVTSPDVLRLLKQHDKHNILEYLGFKLDYSPTINYKTYELAAKVLRKFAAAWIREQWQKRKENQLLIFAPALAACLPFEEAFSIVTTELERMPKTALAENSSALLYFESCRTLGWIQRMKNNIENVSARWGVLAAASEFDWDTAEKWLAAGRPLSLIALDALIYCTATGENVQNAAWFRAHPPTLAEPARPEIIARMVTAYIEKDNVPRTRSAVKQIINNLFLTDLEFVQI